MTAVIYARYSSDNQREESIEGQIRECTAYAEKNGITIVKHYIDRAFSAKTDNRPEFQQMIKDSEKRLFDIVLVWKLDRFARNRYDSAHYEMCIRDRGRSAAVLLDFLLHFFKQVPVHDGRDAVGHYDVFEVVFSDVPFVRQQRLNTVVGKLLIADVYKRQERG